MRKILILLTAAVCSLQLMAVGTATDPYLNITKYATIDEAGATVDGMESIYKYTQQGTGYWLTVSNYGVMKTDETQNWFTNTNTDSDTGSEYTNAWTATDVFQGPSAYFGESAAYSAKYKMPTKTQTFYVTFCTQVKQYAYNRSNSSYYLLKMEIFECTKNADGSLNEGSTAIETLTNQDTGVGVLTSSELDPEKIYKVVISNSYSYLYEIAFKTPGIFDGEVTTPVAYDVTGLALEHATMSWSPCPGATSYTLRTYPYTPEGLYYRENFSNCSDGEDYEDYVSLPGADHTGWMGCCLHGVDGGVMIDTNGYLSTPSDVFAYPFLKFHTIKFKAKSYGDDTDCQIMVQVSGQTTTYDLTPEEQEFTIVKERTFPDYYSNSSVYIMFQNPSAEDNHRPVLTQYKVYFGDYSDPQRVHSPKYVVPSWSGDTTTVSNITDTIFSFGTASDQISHFNYTNAYWHYDVKSVYYDGQESEWSNQIIYSLAALPVFLEDDDDPVTLPGDVNGDGEVTSFDITTLYNFILNNDDSFIVNGDQDGDGEITSHDITIVYEILLQGK